MRVLTSLASSNMARAARRFASNLSCLCFSFVEILGGDVRRGRRFARFGGELLEALRRVGEARRQVGDRSLQGEGERVALGAQVLQARIVEVLVPKRCFNGGQRRSGLFEVEPMGLLRARAAKRHEDKGENNPAQQAQCGCRLHRRLDGPRHDSASVCHPTMAALRPQPGAVGEAFTLGEVRGCALGPALLKGGPRPMRAIW